MKNDVITLIVRVEAGQNADGAFQYVEHPSEASAEVKSVKRTEFYMANRNGIDLDLTAVVNLVDFHEAAVETDGRKQYPSMVEYDGTRYRIKRSYAANRSDLELMLQEMR